MEDIEENINETTPFPNGTESYKMYIETSRRIIDTFINEMEYKKAFQMLILVLGRLYSNDKDELINYYSKNLEKMGMSLF